MTSVNEALAQVQHTLERAGTDSPAAEAAIIVAHVLDISRGELSIKQILGDPIEPSDIAEVRRIATQRATRMPLRHILGVTGFYGLDIAVEPGVFIPRVETEVLVETALGHAGTFGAEITILDLCTGTGAIAAALADQLARRGISVRVWAVDINPAAVQLAQRNTADYNVTVLLADATDATTMIEADPRLEGLLGAFDVVVTNPPYIPTSTPVTQAEALHDPSLALYGGSDDGTQLPRTIADQALDWLAPGGFFIMEHDHSHAVELAAGLTAHAGWEEVTTVQDLTGTDRFVSAVRAVTAQPTPKTHPNLAQ